MKKSIIVLAILIMGIGMASAQEMNPFRIEVGMDGPYAAEVTYAIPINSSSLSLTGGFVLGQGIGWLAEITYYPFNSLAKGWYGSAGITYTDLQDVFICAGYHFIFWDWLSLRLGFRVGYNLNGEIFPGTGSSFSFPPAIMIGVAF